MHISRAFSLLELMIVMAIITLLAAAGAGFYRGYLKTVESDIAARSIITDMKLAQSKAMTGEGGYKWGAHFVNGTDDYYEIFSTPTNYADGSKSVIATTTLSKGVTFSDPAESSSKDIIFNKISGTTTASTVVLSAEGGTQTITVTGIGTIY